MCLYYLFVMFDFVFCHLMSLVFNLFFFFFKQKTAYEMRISDWSSDVCSSDLSAPSCRVQGRCAPRHIIKPPRARTCDRAHTPHSTEAFICNCRPVNLQIGRAHV